MAVCFFWAKLLLRKLDISEVLSSVGTPGKKTSILRTAGDPNSKEQKAEIEKSLALNQIHPKKVNVDITSTLGFSKP